MDSVSINLSMLPNRRLFVYLLEHSRGEIPFQSLSLRCDKALNFSEERTKKSCKQT
jgi:hypothetical protein